MRCKRHSCEQGPGVCAPCLRDRLLDLLAAQNEHLSPVHNHHHRKPDPPPLPPRSVSPDASRHRFRRFFSTPEVCPAAAGGSRFSFLSHLFGHRRSEEKEPDTGVSKDSESGSWLRALIRGRRRKKKSRLYEEEVPGRATAAFPAMNRGMSPAAFPAMNRGMSPAMEDSDCESVSGYSTASSGPWRMPNPSPMRRTPAAAHRNHHHHHHHHIHGVSGFGVWLSPVMRASPARRRRQASEVGFSGELRGASNPIHHRHASGGGADLGPNRSRKLADVGRFR